MTEEDFSLEADARLAGEAPRRLLDLYLELQSNHRDVWFNGRERRAWERADQAVRDDLEHLVAAVDSTPAQQDPDELADLVSSMNARAPDLDSAAVIGTLFDELRARVGRIGSVRTRFVGAKANEVDWEHAKTVLTAWHASLTYSDGDGDETYLPSEAEALVELWIEAAAKKKSLKTVEATGPARAYAPRERYRVGDAIAHARFGDGVVVSITDATAVIRFASGDKKLAHAPPSESRVERPSVIHGPAVSPAAPREVKRLPPDPRLLEGDAPEQFADLANEDSEPED